jgi:hypothetical protein
MMTTSDDKEVWVFGEDHIDTERDWYKPADRTNHASDVLTVEFSLLGTATNRTGSASIE